MTILAEAIELFLDEQDEIGVKAAVRITRSASGVNSGRRRVDELLSRLLNSGARKK